MHLQIFNCSIKGYQYEVINFTNNKMSIYDSFHKRIISTIHVIQLIDINISKYLNHWNFILIFFSLFYIDGCVCVFLCVCVCVFARLDGVRTIDHNHADHVAYFHRHLPRIGRTHLSFTHPHKHINTTLHHHPTQLSSLCDHPPVERQRQRV